MRIIAGSAKGIRLAPPPDRAIRPTLDRVREAFFSIVGPQLEGSRFLDLFAGTGANGLEALSRGASHADFLEADPKARALIQENAKRTRLADRVTVRPLTLPEGLAQLSREDPYDFIYADPPHQFSDYESLFTSIDEAKLDNPGAIVVLEHPTRTPIPDTLGRFTRTRTATYGETSLSFFVRN